MLLLIPEVPTRDASVQQCSRRLLGVGRLGGWPRHRRAYESPQVSEAPWN